MDIIYLDNSATTRIKTEVLNEMIPYLTTEYGNASSLYSVGRKAKKAIENSRRQVADLINCAPHEIYFTGSGSESDNTALKGFAYANKEKGNHIITSKIEHHAILESCETLERQGFEVSYIGVDENGKVDLEELKKAIKSTTILISIMSANNEIGTIQPIEQIAKIAHDKKIIFHTDAVQAIGNMPIDVQKMQIDMLSLSGHKINAPKGIGALYIKKEVQVEKYINGGHQERNQRAGTENVSGIVGLGKACEIANKKIPSKVIYEDDVVISYLDINPDSNGHTLIIPKKHYTDLVDIDDATLSHIMSVARNLKKLLEDKLKIDGLTLIQNNGDVQEVKHYHLHLKPYYKEKQEILPIDDIYNKIKMS